MTLYFYRTWTWLCTFSLLPSIESRSSITIIKSLSLYSSCSTCCICSSRTRLQWLPFTFVHFSTSSWLPRIRTRFRILQQLVIGSTLFGQKKTNLHFSGSLLLTSAGSWSTEGQVSPVFE